MSWGLKIAFLYAGFVAFIITMVTLTMREKVDLVSKDYYEQELKHQDKINQINSSNSLKESLKWEVNKSNHSIQLNFPEDFKNNNISGKCFLFRPSDSQLDKTYSIQNNNGSFEINTKELTPGLYKLQINWQVNGIKYYNEGVITL